MLTRLAQSSKPLQLPRASATLLLSTRTSSFRSFHSSLSRRDGVIGSAPPKKPIGAFRGGLFGFLLGSVGAGAATYYYILQEYRVSNELLTEDIFRLQAAVQRIEAYTKTLEAKVEGMQSRKLQS